MRATIKAASCSQADVAAAIALAEDGDTVSVPAGTATWTTGLSLGSKSLILIGAGSEETIITDNVSLYAIDLLAEEGKSYRISGFTFVRGTVAKTGQMTCIFLRGETDQLRIDHCRFHHINTSGQTRAFRLASASSIIGVADHNVFLMGTGSLNGGLGIYHGSWGGGTAGDVAWTLAAEWGSDQFLFVEDNVFIGDGATIADLQSGARAVFRFNRMQGVNGGAALHGSESGGRSRSPRAIETYHNTYVKVGSALNTALHRGGGLMAHNNTFSNYTGLWGVRNLRSAANFGVWAASDGSNPLDLNDGVVYASGTHTGPNGSNTLIDSTKTWTVNQWSAGGYSVRNTTKGHGSYIVSNTATALTPGRISQTGEFDTGDSYQILRATKVFDAMGRGAGVLVSGNPPTLPEGATWVEQADEPSYQWNNKICGTSGCVPVTPGMLGGVATDTGGVIGGLNNSATPHIRNNRDVHQHNAAFDGTAGVGVGPIASRPATCSVGAAYWATDEGDWNTTTEEPSGRLYKCTAPNTWTLYYEPFTYPHPLTVESSGGKPLAPRALVIS